ncbi:LysR family transcriptional regulator [Deinococcus koreensis]|uniref:LysR family transcriptional regulator n=1 Tax=Deinococcus koreensis TaxID=2054903 RepID=A0A2K3UVM6_9DEIO|nr:LysR family transcriptional regulator [Deinococcus koreensis]PNY80593.1 LysR family transcriptional regulator [Deinococcus koreensis]
MTTGKPLHPAQPTLSQLRALIAVADAGGFSEAAAELGVSQSSLSEAVGKLEEVVGRPLLRRTPSGTRPTPAGERTLTYARAAVQAAGDVVLAAQEDDRLAGALRIASFRSTATHLLPPVLAAFRREHPGVSVRLLDGEANGGGEELLRRGQVDLALVVGEEISGLRLTPLLEDEYLFVAPASRGDHPVSAEELGDADLLLPPNLDSCHARVKRYLHPLGVTPARVTEVDQDSVILSMVGHGLGVTIMARLALMPVPGDLVLLPLPHPLSRPLALAALPQRAHLPLIRAFTAALVESLGERGAAHPARRGGLGATLH